MDFNFCLWSYKQLQFVNRQISRYLLPPYGYRICITDHGRYLFSLKKEFAKALGYRTSNLLRDLLDQISQI